MAHLENVSTEELRHVLTEIEGKKPTQRLMAAINWKEEDDARQRDIAQRYGYTQGWLSQWLTRLERLETEPFEDVVYDEPRSGRPTELSQREHEQFVNALHEPPKKVGINAPAWSVPIASNYLSEEFDVDYCDRHVQRLMTKSE